MGKIVRGAADDIKDCANGMEIVVLNHIHRLTTFFFPRKRATRIPRKN
jgi:hypothetical protein